jgi:hypothetical protein
MGEQGEVVSAVQQSPHEQVNNALNAPIETGRDGKHRVGRDCDAHAGCWESELFFEQKRAHWAIASVKDRDRSEEVEERKRGFS